MRTLLVGLALSGTLTAHAAPPAVYQKTVALPLTDTYQKVYDALDNGGFYVAYELDIGENLARFKQQWGDDYNRQQLAGIRSMVFCQGRYANAISNADPTMLALCPLHLTVIEKGGKSTVLFVRPGVVAKGSPALGKSRELEALVIRTVEEAFKHDK